MVDSVNRILFFDGVCTLCNRFVDWVIQRDQQSQIYFASLQGDTARSLLKTQVLPQNLLNSIILWENGELWFEDEAVLRVLAQLDGYRWNVVAQILRLIPRCLRRVGYKVVAKYRYQIFGKNQVCRRPTSEEQRRFLP